MNVTQWQEIGKGIRTMIYGMNDATPGEYIQTAKEAENHIKSVRKRMTKREAAQWVHRLIYSPPAPNWTDEARAKWVEFYNKLTATPDATHGADMRGM